ncbi:hypothetical protein GLOTRDRAFT_110953 [Gloeophyllum trabeum ATCC 11539]|uniref:Uncharacterized protein n=1 Tax=Gloeophyllum trabeum (strain ATCC 11539 / FP-39264 / Madison 617) TaxID=670483 RepID=S7Q816_GLOTA|nr:uncharacterized protein GLOTRDRAFT_110953 [Gloeophyllum trabeum ATCC 11539]EPQ55588.1 hypothetical protein GLOTRDRAFT_110953 [Gloeophyllum trabeum ATCC 11539]
MSLNSFTQSRHLSAADYGRIWASSIDGVQYRYKQLAAYSLSSRICLRLANVIVLT